jgi:hypothetical protein
MHFYDNFTKPMSPNDVTGSLVLLDSANKEVASFPLSATRDKRTMEARIPTASAALPLNAAVRVKFKAGEKDNFFNFPFTKLTVEPATPAAPPRTSATSATPAASTALAATPVAPPREPLTLDQPVNMPAVLADAVDESRLPKSSTGLLTELDVRAGEIGRLLAAGELAQLWLPAMGTKTVALVLDAHATTLPERQRGAAAAAVKQIVVASWEIDSYGDLGDRQKLTDAYGRLTGAVRSLKALYAQ